MENGYSKKEVQQAMKEKEERIPDDNEKESTRGIISMPHIPDFTTRFNKIAKQHKFKVANKRDNKVKDLISKAKTPLGDRNSHVVYCIPCKCDKYAYVGETDRKWKTRRKEHQDKVRLTNEDVQAGNMERATKRMNEGDGGLAKHNIVCDHEVNWEEAKIMGKERGWAQRKYLEGIETLRQKDRGRTPLNSYNQLEQWQSTIYSLFDKN